MLREAILQLILPFATFISRSEIFPLRSLITIRRAGMNV
jgi:hypothetical protein